MSEENPSQKLLDLIDRQFKGDTTPATKEQLADVYKALIHFRDIVATQAGVLALMPLTSIQASHFNESELPLKGLQKAIGDGLVNLAGEADE